jgi:hypothetical protein
VPRTGRCLRTHSTREAPAFFGAGQAECFFSQKRERTGRAHSPGSRIARPAGCVASALLSPFIEPRGAGRCGAVRSSTWQHIWSECVCQSLQLSRRRKMPMTRTPPQSSRSISAQPVDSSLGALFSASANTLRKARIETFSSGCRTAPRHPRPKQRSVAINYWAARRAAERGNKRTQESLMGRGYFSHAWIYRAL